MLTTQFAKRFARITAEYLDEGKIRPIPNASAIVTILNDMSQGHFLVNGAKWCEFMDAMDYECGMLQAIKFLNPQHFQFADMCKLREILVYVNNGLYDYDCDVQHINCNLPVDAIQFLPA